MKRNATQDSRTLVAVFHDPAQAQQAVQALRQAGFREDQIGVMAHDTRAGGTTTGESETRGSHPGEGAAVGAAAGAGVGALWALGIVAGVLPAIGPAIAGGILASVLASAAGTAVVGGIVGALVGLGIPEEEARYYEGEFRSGRTLVTVRADGRYDEAWTILSRFGAYNRETAATTGTATCATHADTGKTVQVREEHLHAHKQPVEKGEVRVRKEVVTEQQTLHVPVEREEVVIERRPTSGAPAASSDIREGEEIRIPVKEEQVRVGKEAVVKEEVSVGKRKVQDTEAVSGTVRKEQVKVEEKGDVHVRDDADKGKRP